MLKKKETTVHKLDKKNKKQTRIALEQSSKAIREGGLVCFPTETVYGIGADATNDKAVADIFRAKNRSFENPMALHLHSVDEVEKYVKDISDRAQTLMDKFLPGPLMLIFNKNENVSDIVTGGMRKVGIRIPRHDLCLDFLRECGRPVAATSANESGRLACVKPSDILGEMEGKFDILLDGGRSPLGIESTVLDVTTDPPRILRPGFISMSEIAMTIGIPPIFSENVIKSSYDETQEDDSKVKMIVLEGPEGFVKSQIKKFTEMKEKKVGIVLTDELAGEFGDHPVLRKMGSREDPVTIAHNLFEILRDMEKKEVELIIVEGIPREGIGRTLMIKLCQLAEECLRPDSA
ncbi:MAG: L-threonylcarbamoyladenylate synthase [Vulcanimicrobiota bacterium]